MCQNVPKTIQNTGQVTGQDNMQVIWDITNRKSDDIHQNQHAIVYTKKRCYNDSKYTSHFSNFFRLILHTFRKLVEKEILFLVILQVLFLEIYRF